MTFCRYALGVHLDITKASCKDSKIIYLFECDKERFKNRCIGFTIKDLRERICQHLGYVRNKMMTKATGKHFNLSTQKYQF